jgi:hypothetical protein
MMRPATAIRPRLARAGALHPLPHGALADSGVAADLARRPAELQYLAANFCSTMGRQPGILVDVHPGILLIDLARLATTSFNETPRMDNPPADDLVRLHSLGVLS